MATKIEYWDAESMSMVLSERKYDLFSVYGRRRPHLEDDGWAETITLCLDVESGVVVHDLAAHERSFKP